MTLITRSRKFPTESQTLLLKILIADAAEIRPLWQWWVDVVDFDRDVHATSTMLLVRLAQKLVASGCTEGPIARIQGLKRYYWAQGQLMQRAAEDFKGVLTGVGIPLIDLSRLPDSGFRIWHGKESPRILIGEQHRQAAYDMLQDRGWSPFGYVPPSRLPLMSGFRFQNEEVENEAEKAMEQRVWLRWKLIDACCWPGADRHVWERATQNQPDDGTFRLSNEDQILYTCCAASSHDSRYALVIADLLALVANPVDWDAVFEAARQRQVVSLVADKLKFLKDTLAVDAAVDVDLPPDAMRAENLHPIIIMPRPEIRRLWGRYRRYAVHEPLEKWLLWGFLRYLQYWLGLGRIRATVFYLMRRGGRI